MGDFEAVKQRADIVDVIAPYVALQKAGRYFKACCPFHTEKTPSFYVYPDRQSWHCYGACSTGGDVFTFLEKKENLTPVEALKSLAERYGIELERRGRQGDEPASNRLIDANEAAAQFFHNLLLNAQAGASAREYVERRGLDAETVRTFQLGASSDAWESLKEHLTGRGFTVEELMAAGLLVEGERGARDRFRGRLMFPIRDERGRVIGFGGRVLGEGVPKYLNTPQTPLFDKSGTLYALDRAKDAVRAAGVVVVVEGYMDAIAAHQHGISNVVATLGTAITERHVALLKRYARQVVLAMDADAAGVEAALRGEELIRTAAADKASARTHMLVDSRGKVRQQAVSPVELLVFTVPHGKDPDEAIRADPAAFQELARNAVPPFEFRLRQELRRVDRSNPHDRLTLADQLLPLVAEVSDRRVQAQYLSRLAHEAAISEEVLRARLNQLKPERPPPVPSKEPVDQKPSMRMDAGLHDQTESSQGVSGQHGPRAPGGRTEASCLRLLLTYDELRNAGLALEGSLFTDPAHRALFVAWKTAPDGLVAEVLDEDGQALHARVLAERMPPFDAAAAATALTDVVRRLRLRRLEDRSRLIAAAMREGEAEPSADPARAAAAALAALTGERDAAEEDEAAARLLQSLESGRDRHALETTLRTRGGAAPTQT
jgi:DNA primase